MQFVGIDIGAERHVVAVVDEPGKVVTQPTPFAEDAAGYAQVRALLPPPAGTLVALEATGQYWQNLFAALARAGYALALLNPVRTHHFAAEDLRRAKTAAIDAGGIARFAAPKRPPATALPDAATRELRELVRLRERLVQEQGDRARRLHRLVDRGFPEFAQQVRDLAGPLATALLAHYPSAAAFRAADLNEVALREYAPQHYVGTSLAQALLSAAQVSVGAHHGPTYALQVRYAGEDLTTLRERLRALDHAIAERLGAHQVGTLLTTIPGIGPQTAACLVAEPGDPARFADAAHLASYLGVVSGTRQSGKRARNAAPLSPRGSARLRAALWMPTLTAVRCNPWLQAFYQGLRARGKPAKLALVAAMRKLIGAVYRVAKHRRAFAPHLNEAEALR